MNWIQRFLAYWFNREYVILVHHDNSMPVKHAYQLGGDWYAHPYLPDTRCKLLPNGDIEGQSYIKAWKPVTSKMFELFKTEKLLDE